jgi:tetratricopeptide (TPR) repeat protein
VDVLQRERPLLERLEAPELAGHYYFQLARAYSLLGNRERATENALRSVKATSRTGDDVTQGKAHYILARESFWLGEPGRGLEHGQEAVRLLEGRDEPYWRAMAYTWTGQSHYLVGEFGAAVEAMGRARDLAKAIGDSRLQSDIAWRTAQAEATRGECETAIELCEQALKAPSSHSLNRANALARLGLAHVEAGDPATAIPVLKQAEEAVARIAPKGQARGWFLVVLAEAYFLSGDLQRARERGMQALEILEAARYRDAGPNRPGRRSTRRGIVTAHAGTGRLSVSVGRIRGRAHTPGTGRAHADPG